MLIFLEKVYSQIIPLSLLSRLEIRSIFNTYCFISPKFWKYKHSKYLSKSLRLYTFYVEFLLDLIE